jgi:hypothetical protein
MPPGIITARPPKRRHPDRPRPVPCATIVQHRRRAARLETEGQVEVPDSVREFLARVIRPRD